MAKIKEVKARVTDEVYEMIRMAAYRSHRSITGWVTKACMIALENNSVPPAPPPRGAVTPVGKNLVVRKSR